MQLGVLLLARGLYGTCSQQYKLYTGRAITKFNPNSSGFCFFGCNQDTRSLTKSRLLLQYLINNMLHVVQHEREGYACDYVEENQRNHQQDKPPDGLLLGTLVPSHVLFPHLDVGRQGRHGSLQLPRAGTKP